MPIELMLLNHHLSLWCCQLHAHRIQRALQCCDGSIKK